MLSAGIGTVLLAAIALCAQLLQLVWLWRIKQQQDQAFEATERKLDVLRETLRRIGPVQPVAAYGTLRSDMRDPDTIH